MGENQEAKTLCEGQRWALQRELKAALLRRDQESAAHERKVEDLREQLTRLEICPKEHARKKLTAKA